MKDGGPAFPSHGTMGEVNHQGMSLRDWFAGMALQGMLASLEEKMAKGDDKAGATAAYVFADAMLKAREPQSQGESHARRPTE